MTLSVVGKSVVRKDLRQKLTGEARYAADLKLPRMLCGQILRSPHPHANIMSVDTTRAAQLPGVYAIVAPFDAPPGRVAPDTLVLDTRVRFVADEVAAVVLQECLLDRVQGIAFAQTLDGGDGPSANLQG